jgi:glycosyltransferase involved in cell wall biosynthesis
MSDLVSVIVPAHNAAPFLEETVRSALAQTYPQLEILVVDDASRDETAAIAARIEASDPRVRVLRFLKNVGAARARNVGIEAATGRYIAFLDADDVWLPEKTERQVALLEASGAALCYTGYRTMDEHGTRKQTVIHVPRTVTYAELLRTNVIPCSSAIYDTRRIGKVYMPHISKRQDYALWLHILRSARARPLPAAVGIDEPLFTYRVRAGSVSSNKVSAARYQWAVYREIERMPLMLSVYCFAHYAFHGFMKHRRY